MGWPVTVLVHVAGIELLLKNYMHMCTLEEKSRCTTKNLCAPKSFCMLYIKDHAFHTLYGIYYGIPGGTACAMLQKYATCEIMPVKCYMPHATCEIMPVTCEKWVVRCEMRHVKCEMWHATCDLWDARCQMPDAKCYLWHVTCDILPQESGTRRQFDGY